MKQKSHERKIIEAVAVVAGVVVVSGIAALNERLGATSTIVLVGVLLVLAGGAGKAKWDKPDSGLRTWWDRRVANQEADKEIARQVRLLTAVPKVEAETQTALRQIDADLARLDKFGNWYERLLTAMNDRDREFWERTQNLTGQQIEFMARMFGFKLEQQDRQDDRTFELDKIKMLLAAIPEPKQQYGDLPDIVRTFIDLENQISKIPDSRARQGIRKKVNAHIEQEQKRR